MDEFGLIATYFRPLAAGFAGSLDLTDDAALIDVPAGERLVITKDAIVEGVHFIGNEDAALIARKLLRVNLSDLAGKGARPLCYFLAAMLPRHMDERWIAGFAEGLAEDQRTFGIHLAGGDTTATSGPLSLSLTALGTMPEGTMLRRSGAKAGDDVYVSGTLGDGALGLKLLQGHTGPLSDAHRSYLQQRYLLPEPRVATGMALRGIASASMDISDGLVQDLGHLCTASGIGAMIEVARIPLSPAGREWMEKDANIIEIALTGGDDYELLVTAPPSQADAIQTIAKEIGVTLTRVGIMTEGSGVTVKDAQGNPLTLPRKGYRHFT